MSSHRPVTSQPPATLGGRISNTLEVNDIRACLGIFATEDSTVRALEIATNSTSGSTLVLGVWNPTTNSVDAFLTGSSTGITLSQPLAAAAATFASVGDGTATLTGGALSGATSVTASGAVIGGSLSDGTATLTGGALNGVTTLSATTITDGTAVLSSGALDATNVNASGRVTAGSFTDGTIAIAGGDITNVNNLTASGTITAGNLSVTNFESTNLEVSAGGALYFGALDEESTWRIFHDTADNDRLKAQFHDGTEYVTKDIWIP